MSGLNTPVKPLVLAIAMASNQAFAVCNTNQVVNATAATDDGTTTTFAEAVSGITGCGDSTITIDETFADYLIENNLQMDFGANQLIADNRTVIISGPDGKRPRLYISNSSSQSLYITESGYAELKNLELYGGNNEVNRTGNTILQDSGTLIVDNVKIGEFHHGESTGGVIRSSGALTVKNSDLIENHSPNYGGVIYSSTGGTLNISNSTFTNNDASTGGAVYSSQVDTTITESQFNGNTAQRAGAIYIFEGDLTITDTVFDGNTTSNVANTGGGAIYQTNEVNSSDLIVNDSTFQNNIAYAGGGAIHRQYGSGTVLINETDFISNTSNNWSGGSGDAKGGAIYIQPTTDTTISNSTFESNVSKHQGGAIYALHYETGATMDITDSVFDGNQATSENVEAATSYGDGANIYMKSYDESGALTVNVAQTEFTNGVADRNGGAIYLDSADVAINLTMEDSLIQGQQVQGAGSAAYVTSDNTLIVNRSLITDNTGASTIALPGNSASAAPILQMTNSTVSENTNTYGAIIYSGDHGLNNFIKHSTITNNTTTNGGSALYGNGVTSSDAVVISHSIVSNNTGGTAALCQLGEANFAFAVDHTLIDNGDGLGGTCLNITDNGGNQIGTELAPIDPLLGSLQDNGGATLSYAPAINSPAVDAGDANIVDAPELDQRGSARVLRGVIDLGAVEIGNTLPVFTGLEDYTIEVDENVAWDIDLASDADGDSLEYNVSGLPTGVTFNENLSSIVGSISADVYQTSSTYEVEISANDGFGTTTETRTLTFTNEAPVLPSFDDVSLTVGSELDIEYDTATDSDSGAQIQYLVSGLPDGVKYNNGIIRVVATDAMIENGPFTITVEASDGFDSVSESFTLTVTATPEDDDDGFLGLGSLNYAWLALLGMLGFRRRS